MLSLATEIAALRDRALLDDARAEPLLAIERRQIFSIHAELRIVSYIAVLLIVTGTGILLKANAARLGPLAILALIIAASAACYAWVIRKHLAQRNRSIVDEYVLLLGALLLSGALGYMEHQFHLLGGDWQRHLLLLALLHGVTAYWLGSRLVLSAALTALAAWLGFENRRLVSSAATDTALRGALFVLLILGIRYVNRVAARGRAEFDLVYAHSAAIAGYISALLLTFDRDTRWTGMLAIAALDVLFLTEGVKRKREMLVAYALVASVIAIDVIAFSSDAFLGLIVALLTAIASIVALFAMRRQFRTNA